MDPLQIDAVTVGDGRVIRHHEHLAAVTRQMRTDHVLLHPRRHVVLVGENDNRLLRQPLIAVLRQPVEGADSPLGPRDRITRRDDHAIGP